MLSGAYKCSTYDDVGSCKNKRCYFISAKCTVECSAYIIGDGSKDAFYTLIPTECGFKQPPIIKDFDMLKFVLYFGSWSIFFLRQKMSY